jgi:hypothetical protein
LIVMDPVTAPAASGANVAVNVLTWPAVNVNGVVIPEMLNPVPAAVAEETVTLAVPPFVSVIVCVPVPPTATFPNAAVPGVAVS